MLDRSPKVVELVRVLGRHFPKLESLHVYERNDRNFSNCVARVLSHRGIYPEYFDEKARTPGLTKTK